MKNPNAGSYLPEQTQILHQQTLEAISMLEGTLKMWRARELGAVLNVEDEFTRLQSAVEALRNKLNLFGQRGA